MSVISPEPDPLSCTILSPVNTSPLTVSSSNTIWSTVVPSTWIPPFTTETFAVTPPPFVPVFVKVKSSPISKPEPPSSINTSSILPDPTLSTWMIAPWPPPVRVIASPELNNPPSFVIVTISGIPVISAFINVSDSSVSVPLISS